MSTKRMMQKLCPQQLKSPVPSDIAISQSMTPVHISEIAQEFGIVSEVVFKFEI